MEVRFDTDCVRYRRMTTEELRQAFLIETLFNPGRIDLVYSEVERAVIGSAVPQAAPLTLTADEDLRAEYFCERRELGVINIGGAGTIRVDGQVHAMAPRDCLYIGRGSQSVVFESAAAAEPAAFYLLSYPAHAAYPTTHATKAQANRVQLGSSASCNERTIYQFIHMGGIQSCQLVMGYTELATGSNWNTMPCHTHARRSEVYCYFDLAEDQVVFHMMGCPDETRHLVMRNRQAAISPIWSIHSGTGTSNYTFIWGMGGENQTFTDMDPVAMTELK